MSPVRARKRFVTGTLQNEGAYHSISLDRPHLFRIENVGNED